VGGFRRLRGRGLGQTDAGLITIGELDSGLLKRPL
jgi:hypothetical protein